MAARRAFHRAVGFPRLAPLGRTPARRGRARWLVDRVLRDEDPPHPGRALRLVPLGEGEEAARRTAPRFPARLDEGGPERSGDRPRESRAEPADPGGEVRRPRPPDAPEGQARRRAGRGSRGLGQDGGAGPEGRAGEPGPVRCRGSIDVEAGRKHWAFQPLGTVSPPDVRDRAWCRNPIDRFILAALEAKGIRPNPEADRRQLVRRLTFDLIGLPPTPEEVDAFVDDPTPDAYDRLVDRLLASPHYGERWGRHWLDLARFAESHGFEHDYDRPDRLPLPRLRDQGPQPGHALRHVRHAGRSPATSSPRTTRWR